MTRWLESATVSDFFSVDAHPIVKPQFARNRLWIVSGCDTMQMEREKRFSCAEVGLDRTERLMLGITLPSSALPDRVTPL